MTQKHTSAAGGEKTDPTIKAKESSASPGSEETQALPKTPAQNLLAKVAAQLRLPEDAELNALAKDLGVLPQALRAVGALSLGDHGVLEHFGVTPVETGDNRWAVVPESGGDGQVVGYCLLNDRGVTRPIEGASSGLLMGEVPDDTAIPVVIAHDLLNTLTLLSLGLTAISCRETSDVAKLDKALEGRDVIVLADLAPKSDSSWPTMAWASGIAKALANRLGRAVRLAMPPDDARDLLGWLEGRGRPVNPDDWPRLGHALLDALQKQTKRIQPTLPTRTGLCVRMMSEIDPVDLTWHWPGWIPKGKFVLLVGDPGVGKSFLIADLTASLTAKKNWPDGTEAGDPVPVLLMPAEDDPADTIRPRLDTAGADVKRVRVIDGIRPSDTEGERDFDLSKDLTSLEAYIREHGVQGGVVFIDPLNSFVGDTNLNSNTATRQITNRLTKLASDLSITIVGIMHLNKNEEADATNRIIGAVALTAAARFVCMVGKHPEDPARKVLMPAKSNVSELHPGLVFELTDDPTPKIRWTNEQYEGDANTLAASGKRRSAASKLCQAIDFLNDYLAKGPKKGTDVIEAANEAGIAKRTIERAAIRLKILKNGGPGSRWALKDFGAEPLD